MNLLQQIGERLKLKFNEITTALNNFIGTKNMPNGIAGLDAGGKINPAQLPSLAITDTYVVASEAFMLALTAERGDVAIRSDINKSYLLSADDPTVLANWVEILTPGSGVTSFNARTGIVTLQESDVTGVSGTYAEFLAALETGLL